MPRLFAVQLKDGPAERYEQWVNTPIYTHDYEDCVGWLGCELPEDGHSCEFAELAGDGAVTCASSSKVNRLREENAKLRWLAKHFYEYRQMYFKTGIYPTDNGLTERYMSELGIEVEE